MDTSLKKKKMGLKLKTNKKHSGSPASNQENPESPRAQDTKTSKENTTALQRNKKCKLRIPYVGNWKELEDLPFLEMGAVEVDKEYKPAEHTPTDSPPRGWESVTELPPPCVPCLTRRRPTLLTPDQWLFSTDQPVSCGNKVADVSKDGEQETNFAETEDDIELFDDKDWDDMMANIEGNHLETGPPKIEESFRKDTSSLTDGGKYQTTPIQHKINTPAKIGTDIGTECQGRVDTHKGSTSKKDIRYDRTPASRVEKDQFSVNRGRKDKSTNPGQKNCGKRVDVSSKKQTEDKVVNSNCLRTEKKSYVYHSRNVVIPTASVNSKPSKVVDAILLSSDSDDEPSSPPVVSQKRKWGLGPGTSRKPVNTVNDRPVTGTKEIQHHKIPSQSKPGTKSATKSSANPPKNNRQEVAWESCPMCQYEFPKSFMRHEVERHINRCLEADDTDDIAYL